MPEVVLFIIGTSTTGLDSEGIDTFSASLVRQATRCLETHASTRGRSPFPGQWSHEVSGSRHCETSGCSEHCWKRRSAGSRDSTVMARVEATTQKVNAASPVTIEAPGDQPRRRAITAGTAATHNASAAGPVTRRAAHVVAASAMISHRSRGRRLWPTELGGDG